MAAAACGPSRCCSFLNNGSPSYIACKNSSRHVFAVKSFVNGNVLAFSPLATHAFASSKVNTPSRKPVAFCMRATQPSSKVEITAEDSGGQDSVSPSSSSAIPRAESVALGIVSPVEREPRESTDRQRRKKAERQSYLFAAIASSVGVTFLAAGAVYYRFSWQMQGGAVPLTEVFGTFSLAVGAAVGMEFWARWAHRALWHASLWDMHESHHRPRDGPFELNDVFAIINAVPAITLLAYGLFHEGLVPGLCFGAGLGITVFGMAYMFVHDGLVHRRFPVGPIANVPYLQRVAAAHQLHHADKFDGVPYGLFLGPKELKEVGGLGELEKLLQTRKRDLSEYSEATDVLG